MKFTTIGAGLQVIASLVLAQNTNSTTITSLKAATFKYSSHGADFITTVSAAADTHDLFLRVSVPTAYDWVAVGVGASMDNALTLIMYPSKDGKRMTLSPRQSTGNQEPVYNEHIDCKISDNANPNLNDQVVLGIMCHNATQLPGKPALDISSAAAPFMWALGPIAWNNGSSWSDSPKQDLRIHSAAARFTMNMPAATVDSNPEMRIPDLGNDTINASQDATIKLTRNLKTPAHGLLMILAIIVLIPLDSVIRLCWKSTKIHMIMMGVVSTVFIAGASLGFVISGMFNRSKSYHSAHQIIGIIVFILFLSQVPLGIITRGRLASLNSAASLAHRANDPDHSTPPRRTRQPLYIAHLSLAALIGLLTLVNGGLGFQLSLGVGYVVKYALLVTGVFLVWLGVAGIRYMWMQRGQDVQDDEAHERRTKAAIEEYQMRAWEAQSQQQQQQQQQQPWQGTESSYPTESIRRT